MNSDTQNTPSTLPRELATAMARRAFSIGLPRCNNASEKRFPITPEGARLLIEQGFTIRMEDGAADVIHYTSAQYARSGVEVCSRAEALRCDIVIHMAPMDADDIRRMRRGAMALTLMSLCRQTPEAVRELLRRNVIAIALDRITDSRGFYPIADILAEIDGRAAIARAASLLADAHHGKGILLGGVAGVVPCEVTVIGSDIAACAAARSAAGMGATVRMFDHDVYRLRHAMRQLGPAAVGASLHPRGLMTALRTADVVIYTEVTPMPAITAEMVAEMKRGAIIFDLTTDCGQAFRSLPVIDLALAAPMDISPTEATRACYANAGSSVPRTAAMAMSDALITIMRDIVTCEGLTNALKLVPGLQKAAYTFLGKAVDPDIAAMAGTRHVDINIYLTLS
ncbi:MAG: hypothetical protein NC043_00600 [Muribaculaceae bacterium]|nr:hypothetical protein [Muribaculaceae bacterium]